MNDACTVLKSSIYSVYRLCELGPQQTTILIALQGACLLLLQKGDHSSDCMHFI